MTRRTFNRRRFLRRAAGAAGALLATPYAITSNALGGEGRPAASERIAMGTIGLGGRGTHDMQALMSNADVQMLAVCDVQAKRRSAGKRAVDAKNGNADCKTYIDLRELLARADIECRSR